MGNIQKGENGIIIHAELNGPLMDGPLDGPLMDGLDPWT